MMTNWCADCRVERGTVVVPAAHSFDQNGKPNGSHEVVCKRCEAARGDTPPDYLEWVGDHLRDAGSQREPDPGPDYRWPVA